MTRDIRLYLVGSLVLVSLAGCGISFFAQREAWRHEAEVQCLKSGAVKEGPAVALLSPISGPGTCGADFPFKVSALGATAGNAALGYADDPLRPPGIIRGGPDRSPPSLYSPDSPAPYSPAPSQRVDRRELRPLDLAPPGVTAPATIGADPPPRDPGITSSPYPPAFPPGAETVPVAPSRALPTATVAVTPAATLACPVVSALDRWVTESIQPAARRWFGQQVVEIKQISAYSCRGMNGNRSARISEHAFGNALDIAGFVLSDTRVVTVRTGWHGTPEEQGFLRDVQSGACQMFATVLAPGSNRFHYDHIHVDLMRRNSGRSVCRPEAVPGEVVAGRARGRSNYAGRRPSPYGSTGALGSRRKKQAAARLPDAQFKVDRDMPAAIPGED